LLTVIFGETRAGGKHENSDDQDIERIEAIYQVKVVNRITLSFPSHCRWQALIHRKLPVTGLPIFKWQSHW